MPRGPGKKENYNFDYSRFSGLGDEQDAAGRGAAMSAGVPPEIMQNLPGELQEAFRLMAISKATGDVKAQERSTELVMAAIEKGGPEVKQRFSQEVTKQMAKDPASKASLEQLLSGKKGPQAGAPASQLDGLSASIDQLQGQMKSGAESAAQQLEQLRTQQEALENLQGPEDFARFFASQGMSQEDIQRSLAGDTAHMQKMMEKALGQVAPPENAEKAKKMEKALECVDDIHRQLNDITGPDGADAAPPMPTAKRTPARPAEPANPEPKIPEHRVSYAKDESGKLQSVELRVELPGVESMAAIELDVSEKHLRLRTEEPAFVVNVGPFPNLVDASAAKAKFSKKRQELTLSVPAKP